MRTTSRELHCLLEILFLHWRTLVLERRAARITDERSQDAPKYLVSEGVLLYAFDDAHAVDEGVV